MRKIRHMIELTKMFLTIIYIDYFVIVFIFRQITFIISNNDKLNLRLIKNFQYFFDFNLFVRYKIDKINVMSNVLSKFQIDAFFVEKIDVLKSLHKHSLYVLHENLTIKTLMFYHYVALIKKSNDFKQRLKQTY